MEPRRIVLAVVLMAAVLILNSILFPAPKVAPVNPAIATDSLRRADSATVASSNPVVADGARAAQPSMGAVPAGDSAALSAPSLALPIDTAVVTTAPAVFRTTKRGASLIGAEMQQ